MSKLFCNILDGVKTVVEVATIVLPFKAPLAIAGEVLKVIDKNHCQPKVNEKKLKVKK